MGDSLELAELLNTALDKGVVAHGDVTLAVADIDLVRLNLGLLLSAIETVDRRRGASPVAAGRSLAAAVGPPVLDPRATGRALERGARDRGAAVPAEPSGRHPRSGEESESRGAYESPTAPHPGNAPPRDVSLNAVAQGLPERIDADAPGVESGLARLVLTLIEVLRKVLEHQAVRRMEGGRLTPDEVERLGLALARLDDRMQDLKRVFGLSDADLEIDLGPLGRLR